LGWTTLLHPAYSLDIAPSDYHLFRSMEHYFKDKTLQTKSGVKSAIAAFLIPKLRSFLNKAFSTSMRDGRRLLLIEGIIFCKKTPTN
jgi:[histone H3]-lysine36 N-dimethyltransferase SETMAR